MHQFFTFTKIDKLLKGKHLHNLYMKKIKMYRLSMQNLTLI